VTIAKSWYHQPSGGGNGSKALLIIFRLERDVYAAMAISIDLGGVGVILALVIVIIVLTRGLVRQWTPEIELLDRRFGRGELSIEEYQDSKQLLTQMPAATHATDFVACAFKSHVAVYKGRIHYLLVDDEPLVGS
jgi:hypothetical protein